MSIFLGTVSLLLVIVGAFMMHCNERAYQLKDSGIDTVHNYEVSLIYSRKYDMSSDHYSEMLYSYDYMVFHPWLKSAIKPEYQELLKDFIPKKEGAL